VIAFAKLSFAGVVPHSRLKARLGSAGTLSTLPIWIWYVVPEAAWNWTADCCPAPVSSLQAPGTSVPKAFPVYTARTVSYPDPAVLILRIPF